MNKVSAAVEPTGAEHHVDVDRLFFSTTDPRGVITQANSVFTDMARRPHNELVGAPHNIIRHPDMPGGAFHLVWQAIQDGKPTCAYIKNLAGDGSTYWAFATLMPVGDGYLSVRSRPCDDEIKSVVEKLYTNVREQELDLRAGGMSAADTAAVGAEAIEKQLREMGFASFADLSTQVLPAELNARGKQVRELPTRRTANPRLSPLLEVGTRIYTALQKRATSLSSFQHTADELDLRLAAAVDAMTHLGEAVESAGTTATALEDRAAVLANSVPAVQSQCGRVTDSLKNVEDEVRTVLEERSQLLFRVSVAQLQAESVVRYAVELIDGDGDIDKAAAAITSLTDALGRGLGTLTTDLQRNVERAATMGTEIGDASGGVERSAGVVGNWRGIIERKELTAQFSEHLPALDNALTEARQSISALDTAGQAFAGSAAAFNSSALKEDLAQLMRAVRTL